MAGQPRRSAQSSDSEPAGDGGPEEAAAYLATATSDLGRIARRHGLDTLGFLLDMAQMEAEDIARQSGRRNPV